MFAFLTQVLHTGIPARVRALGSAFLLVTDLEKILVQVSCNLIVILQCKPGRTLKCLLYFVSIIQGKRRDLK